MPRTSRSAQRRKVGVGGEGGSGGWGERTREPARSHPPARGYARPTGIGGALPRRRYAEKLARVPAQEIAGRGDGVGPFRLAEVGAVEERAGGLGRSRLVLSHLGGGGLGLVIAEEDHPPMPGVGVVGEAFRWSGGIVRRPQPQPGQEQGGEDDQQARP